MDTTIKHFSHYAFAEIIYSSHPPVIYVIMDGCFQCSVVNSQYQWAVNSGYCKSTIQMVYVSQMKTNAPDELPAPSSFYVIVAWILLKFNGELSVDLAIT